VGTAPPRHRPAAAPPRASSGPSSAGRRSGGADRRHARRGGEDARFDDLCRRRSAPLLLPMQRDPIPLLLCMLPSPPATAVLLLLPLRCSYSPARASSASRPAPRPTRAAAGRRPDRLQDVSRTCPGRVLDMPQPVADRAALLDCGVHPAGRVVAEGGEHLFTAGGVKRRRPQTSRYRLRAAEARRTACNCSQPRGSGRSRLHRRGGALSRPVDDQSGPRTWPRLPTRGRAAPLR